MKIANTSPLPPVHAAWLSDILGGPIPLETQATCDDCAMCTPLGRTEAESFNPTTKCCTYTPALPNFLVGRALIDDDPAGQEGRASLHARIAAGVAVSPLGLLPSPVRGLLYRFGSTQGFGRSRALLCPHYIEDGGRCGIWRHRNGVCATWFCKHDRGEAGATFWDRVQQLFSLVETDLARVCLLELGIEASALAKLFPPSPRAGVPESSGLGSADLDERREPAAAKALWGAWAGREAELYRACAGVVGDIELAEVVRRCGPEVRIHLELVRAAWRRLEETPTPARLRVGQLNVIRMDHAKCRVTTYSPLDPLEMPRSLFDALHHFDGRPTDETLSGIRDAGGPALTPGLVRKMVDFTLLVPVDDGADEPEAGARSRE